MPFYVAPTFTNAANSSVDNDCSVGVVGAGTSTISSSTLYRRFLERTFVIFCFIIPGTVFKVARFCQVSQMPGVTESQFRPIALGMLLEMSCYKYKVTL